MKATYLLEVTKRSLVPESEIQDGQCYIWFVEPTRIYRRQGKSKYLWQYGYISKKMIWVVICDLHFPNHTEAELRKVYKVVKDPSK